MVRESAEFLAAVVPPKEGNAPDATVGMTAAQYRRLLASQRRNPLYNPRVGRCDSITPTRLGRCLASITQKGDTRELPFERSVMHELQKIRAKGNVFSTTDLVVMGVLLAHSPGRCSFDDLRRGCGCTERALGLSLQRLAGRLACTDWGLRGSDAEGFTLTMSREMLP